jgi:hypothetical protein
MMYVSQTYVFLVPRNEFSDLYFLVNFEKRNTAPMWSLVSNYYISTSRKVASGTACIFYTALTGWCIRFSVRCEQKF